MNKNERYEAWQKVYIECLKSGDTPRQASDKADIALSKYDEINNPDKKIKLMPPFVLDELQPKLIKEVDGCFEENEIILPPEITNIENTDETTTGRYGMILIDGKWIKKGYHKIKTVTKIAKCAKCGKEEEIPINAIDFICFECYEERLKTQSGLDNACI